MALFHSKVFMPPIVRKPVFDGKLEYSNHALKEAQSDRYGNIELPETIDVKNGLLIEAEAVKNTDGKLHCFKQVWRVPYNHQKDLCLVVTDAGRVKTVWLNMKTDKHSTLRRELYVKSLSEIV